MIGMNIFKLQTGISYFCAFLFDKIKMHVIIYVKGIFSI